MPEIDFWTRFRAEVAKQMIVPIYEETKRIQRSGGGLRSATDMAIDTSIEIAVTMAQRLEARLKGEKND